MPIEQKNQQVSTREELLLKLSEQRKALTNLLLEGTSTTEDGTQTFKEKKELHQEEIKRLEDLLAARPPLFEENQIANHEELTEKLAFQQQSLKIDKIRLQIQNSRLKTVHKKQALETEKLKLEQLRIEIKKEQLPITKARVWLWITIITSFILFVSFILCFAKTWIANDSLIAPMTAIITAISALVVKSNVTITIPKEKKQKTEPK